MTIDRKIRLQKASTRIIFGVFLAILPIIFLLTSLVQASNDIDVNLTVPNVPIPTSNSTFSCNPREVIVGGVISCQVNLLDDQKNAIVSEAVKIVSSRNKNGIIDVVNPLSQNTNTKGDAIFSITSDVVGEGTLRAVDMGDNSYVGDPIAFKFLPKEALVQSAIFSDITTDKTKLVIGKDKATILVTILDQNKNPMSSVVVTLLYDSQYGDSNQEKGLTNDQGIATFVYTPKKKGTTKIGAKTDAITLGKTVSLEIIENIENLLSPLEQIRKSEIAKQIASALNPIVVTASAFSLLSFLATIIASTPAAFNFLTYLISLLLEALGIRKRRKNWGRVYDSTTGKGVDLALVRLYNQQTMELVGTIVTNAFGRYNFQPKPGTYAITVSKEGFIYPTQIFAKYGLAAINKNAKKYDHHYLGQPINISKDDDFLNLDIPIDPVGVEASFSLKTKIWTEDLLTLVTSGLSYILMPTLILGTIFSTFVAFVITGNRNIITAAVYLLITLIYAITRTVRAQQFGKVIDSEGRPISGVMISLFELTHNSLKETRITDQFGRFLILAETGNYLLKAEKNGYEFNFENLTEIIRKSRVRNKYSGQTISMKKEGYANLTIIGRKI